MSYFNNFQTVNYDVTGQGDYTLLTDFTPNFKVRKKNISRNVAYLNYVIDDGSRPDIVSHYLYGTPEYHWTFFVINDNLRLSKKDWPLSDIELDESVAYKYDQYSILSFDPLAIPGPSGGHTYGNMSCVPLKQKYVGLLRIIPVDGNALEVNSYSLINKYDFSSCQLSIQRSIQSTGTPLSTIMFIDGYDRYKIKPINPITEEPAVGSALRVSWENNQNLIAEYRSEIAAAYGLLESTPDTDHYLYTIAKDGNGNKLNWEYMRNAAYQYFYIDELYNETVALNGYDVLVSDNANYNTVRFISYSEKETIENDRKKTISIVHPNNIVEFAKSYFDTLNNV